MRSGLMLGIDVGTGSVKVTVLDPRSGPVGHGTAGYQVSTPQPGWAEQDPEDWWRGVRRAVRDGCTSAGVPGDAICAVAVSGQGAALVLIDAERQPVRPALIHLDQRAMREAERLAGSDVGAAVRRANGNVIGAWNFAAKIAWTRRHEPDAYAGTSHITSAAGFVLSRLVGRAVQSTSDAGISDLFQSRGRIWSRSVLDTIDVASSMLPELAEATDDVGSLSPAAAEELGLRASTRVVAGGEDTSCAALAAGAVEVGSAYLSLGTAAVVGAVVEEGSIDQPALLTFPHVLRRRDLLSGSMSSAGSAVAWCASVTGTDTETLLVEAEQAPPGSGGVTFLPYLAGEIHPINDPHARGVFSGLSLSTTRAELGRAVLEGSANAVAHNLTVMRAAGARPSVLLATGRPTRSAAWMQAIADATGFPVDCVVEGGASLGDAILAASHGDEEAIALAASLGRPVASYAPHPDRHRAAQERLAASTRLYEATRVKPPPGS